MKSWTWTTKFTKSLQQITKVGMRLQSLLIDYKRQQKTTKNRTYTTKFTNRLQKTTKDYKKSDIHYKVY